MSADAVLVHEGLAEPGGVTVDVRHLADGLGVPAVDTLSGLRNALARNPDAVVHVFGCLPRATTFGAMAVARAARRPLVWTPIFNPIRPATWRGYGLRRPPMEIFDRVAPRAARFCDCVIAATPAERDFFARWTRAELIPPGVAEPPPPPPEDAVSSLRSRLALTGPTVLTIARDNSRKALPFGLAAFAELRRRVPEAQLVLAGPGRDHRYGRLPGVVIAGWLDQDELAVLFEASDVVFVPSLYEGLPRAAIEAWRFAVPVVATDRVALAPAIDGAGGLVVPYGQPAAAAAALARLLADDALREELGAGGRAIVARSFLLTNVVPATARLYAELRRQ